MKKYLLEIAVFLCGAIVMVYEIVGSRVVAPHFGTSIYVWTSLIGIILASLSMGYWLGGRIADKKPSYKYLSIIILVSALLVILTTYLKDGILNVLTTTFSGMIPRTLTGALILFAPASILLGMVSPYAVRLKLREVEHSGRTVGNLYAISTLGSIFGTFMAGFVLIPLFGTTNILYLISFLLLLVAISLFFSFRDKTQSLLSMLILVLTVSGLVSNHTSADEIIRIDTRYNHVQIFDMEYWYNGKLVTVMKLNDEYSSMMYPENDSLVLEYTQYYRLAEHFNPGFSKALILGGAAYSYPKYFLQTYPDASIDVVEIDPGLTAIAKKYFRLQDNPRMQIYHEDGRTFLNHCTEKYDLIYGDAYKSMLSIPFQLTTLEAAQRKYDLLNDEGVLIENIISSIEGPASEFMKTEVATISEVFPQVFLFACHDPKDAELLQSISLVALKSGKEMPFSSTDPQLNSFLQSRIHPDIRPETMILTDDYAPVEHFAMKVL